MASIQKQTRLTRSATTDPRMLAITGHVKKLLAEIAASMILAANTGSISAPRCLTALMNMDSAKRSGCNLISQMRGESGLRCVSTSAF